MNNKETSTKNFLSRRRLDSNTTGSVRMEKHEYQSGMRSSYEEGYETGENEGRLDERKKVLIELGLQPNHDADLHHAALIEAANFVLRTASGFYKDKEPLFHNDAIHIFKMLRPNEEAAK